MYYHMRLSFIWSWPQGVHCRVKWILSKLGAIKLYGYLRLKLSFKKKKKEMIPNCRI